MDTNRHANRIDVGQSYKRCGDGRGSGGRCDATMLAAQDVEVVEPEPPISGTESTPDGQPTLPHAFTAKTGLRRYVA